jgi:hypothetical protein
MLRVGINNFPIQSGSFSTEGMTHAAIGLRQSFPAGKTRSMSARQFGLLAAEMSGNADARARPQCAVRCPQRMVGSVLPGAGAHVGFGITAVFRRPRDDYTIALRSGP